MDGRTIPPGVRTSTRANPSEPERILTAPKLICATLMLSWPAVIPLMLLWMRAAGLVGQAVALGCAVFALVVLRRDPQRRPVRALDLALGLTFAGALAAVLAQAGVLAVLAAALADEPGGAQPQQHDRDQGTSR